MSAEAKLVVKLPFRTPADFLGRYGANVTKGGIYLRTKALKPPGTVLELTVKIESGEVVIAAKSVVAFVTGARPGEAGVPGMGFKFLEVEPTTERMLEAMAAAMPHARATEPPLPRNVGPADTDPEAVPKPKPVEPVAPPPSQEHAPTASMASGRTVVEGDSSAIVAPAFEPSPEPPRDGPIIGIDLGTTNSCAAYVADGKPEVLPSRQGYRTVPSVIALNTKGKLIVGSAAKAQMLTNPRLTVYGSKRLIGRPFESDAVQQIRERFSYEICAGEHGDSAVKLADKVYSLQQVSALLLREVREIAELKLNQPVHRAVITVPAYYNDNQRQAVREAGTLAGLHVERIVNEPTAAALAYGYGRQYSQRVMVYDLGGGTFDASVLQLSDQVYEVISTGGDTFLGGLDFDQAIVDWALEQFEQQHGRKFQGDRVALQRITDAAERAKIALSERLETRIHVPFITMIENKPYDLEATLSRDTLVTLTYPLVERTLKVVREVLSTKGLDQSHIDEVILVGGQSRAPLVREQVEAFFGKAPSRSVHPDEAVATGAALLANALSMKEGVTLIDVLPQAIGVGLPGGYFKPVIERNATLPAVRKYTLSTTRDQQSVLEIAVFQGDVPRAQQNEYLGTLKLGGLPLGPRGAVKVEVTFEVSAEALLKLKAREQSTGREVETVFSTADTPDEVKKRLEQERVEAPVPAAPVAAAAPTGFFGWLKRLFGGGTAHSSS